MKRNGFVRALISLTLVAFMLISLASCDIIYEILGMVDDVVNGPVTPDDPIDHPNDPPEIPPDKDPDNDPDNDPDKDPEDDSEDYEPTEGINYKLSDDGSYAAVKSYNGEATHVVIAKEYEGVPVTAIGDYAFMSASQVVSIIIPEGITSIGDNALYNCTSLTSLTLPASVTSITEGALAYCKSLTEFKVAEGSEHFIAIDGILYTKDGKTLVQYPLAKASPTLSIPEGVETIAKMAFTECKTIQSVIIPDSVKSIGFWGFRHCTNLKDLTIGKGLEVIKDRAFEYCESLVSLELPDGITSIGKYSFAYCKSLKSLSFPTSLTVLNEGLFMLCTALENVYLHDNLELGYGVFTSCTAIIAFTVEESNTRYKTIDGSLYNKEGTSLIHPAVGRGGGLFIVPDGVTRIENYAFADANDLEKIVLPASLTSVGDRAFYTIESSNFIQVYYMGSEAQWYNVEISQIGNEKLLNAERYYYSQTPPEVDGNFWTYLDGVPTSWKFIHIHKAEILPAVPASCTQDGLTEGKKCTDCGEVIVEQQVIPRGHVYAHLSCTGCGQTDPQCFTLNILSDGLYEIAPKDKTNLPQNVVIPTELDGVTVTYVASDAFKDCENIVSVVISDGIRVIQPYAFYNCKNLESVNLSKNLESITHEAFSYCQSLTSITIPGSVFRIDDGAFYHCISLKTVTIENGVSVIGPSAFGDCTMLESIRLPDSVTELGYRAFESCTNLTTAHIGNGLTVIGKFAFTFCSRLKDVSLGSNLKVIDDCAFNCCTALKNIDIPDGVTTINDSAFSGCASLENIVIPDSVIILKYGAFEDCTNLTTVTLGRGITEISHSLFYHCVNLKEILIHSGVTEIGEYAFEYCDNLRTIYFTGSADEWNRISIGPDNSGLSNATVLYIKYNP